MQVGYSYTGGPGVYYCGRLGSAIVSNIDNFKGVLCYTRSFASSSLNLYRLYPLYRSLLVVCIYSTCAVVLSFYSTFVSSVEMLKRQT